MSEIPELSKTASLRWLWRQLTSMRTALILLLLLAIGSIPGSLIPQRDQDQLKVVRFIQDHPVLSQWYERFSLFDVFGSPWFSAIYLLLFLSLIGCVIPRLTVHLGALRQAPTLTPKNLDRLQYPERFSSTRSIEETLDIAESWFKKHRFRFLRNIDSISAEKGYARETGNIVFHLSLILFLIAMAMGSLGGQKGEAIVIEDDTFTNVATSYDNLSHGHYFDLKNLDNFTLKVDKFTPKYELASGAPLDYVLDVTTTVNQKQPVKQIVKVNHPLSFGNTNVYLQANGYAPVVTVRDGSGSIVFDGPVAFLPQDSNFTSIGAIKLPDAQPQQIGFIGTFLPTAVMDKVKGGFSSFPDAIDPRLLLSAWVGDLGLDKGIPQSVYRLDTTGLERIGIKNMAVGDTWNFAEGSITFQGWKRWVNLQIVRDPGKDWAISGAILALFGLMLTLFVKRRRIWVRVEFSDSSGSVISVAGLQRHEYDGFQEEIARLVKRLND